VEDSVLVIWKVPIIVVAAVVGTNKWLDSKLKEQEEKAQEEEEREKKYQIFSENAVPDLYRFYEEMDSVIENFAHKEEEQIFCESMRELVDFMCVCREPEGSPTVQNMVTMAMSAKNSGMAGTGFAEVFKEHLMGEVLRTSPSDEMTAQAVAASAKLIDTMFPESKARPSVHSDYKQAGGFNVKHF
jgi:hypothetical protein